MNCKKANSEKLKVREVYIEGIKTIDKIKIRPCPLTFIMGANDSGKTNICLSLSIVSDILRHGARKIPGMLIGERGYRLKYGPWNCLSSRFSDSSVRFKLETEVHSSKIEYILTIHPEIMFVEQEVLIIDGRVMFQRSDESIKFDSEAAGVPRAGNPDMPFVNFLQPQKSENSHLFSWPEPLDIFRSHLNNIFYIDLQNNDLLKGARGSNPKSELDIEPCGGDLAGLIGYLFDGGTEKVVSFQKEIEELFGITVQVKPEGPGRTLKITDAARPKTEIFPHELAHGTLKSLFFSALKNIEPENSIFMIDELENGLNPKLFNWALSTLKAIAECGNYVFITTHSLTLLNLPTFFEMMKSGYADVLLTKREKGGPTRIKAVSEIINEKYGEKEKAFWEEVPVPLGELLETNYFEF